MTRDLIIKHFTDNIKQYQKYARNIAGEDADDLFQECAVMLLEYPEARLIGYWNEKEGLKPIFLKMLSLQFKSKTSYYHKQYRKQEKFIQDKGQDIVYNEKANDTEELAVEISDVKRAELNVHTLSGELFPSELEELIWNLYKETGSLRKTLAAIPEAHAQKFDLKLVHTIIRKFRKSIKSYLNIVA